MYVYVTSLSLTVCCAGYDYQRAWKTNSKNSAAFEVIISRVQADVEK